MTMNNLAHIIIIVVKNSFVTNIYQKLMRCTKKKKDMKTRTKERKNKMNQTRNVLKRRIRHISDFTTIFFSVIYSLP